MTRTAIKNASNNDLIVKLAKSYAHIVCQEGVRCRDAYSEMKTCVQELKKRGLLDETAIEKFFDTNNGGNL